MEFLSQKYFSFKIFSLCTSLQSSQQCHLNKVILIVFCWNSYPFCSQLLLVDTLRPNVGRKKIVPTSREPSIFLQNMSYLPILKEVRFVASCPRIAVESYCQLPVSVPLRLCKQLFLPSRKQHQPNHTPSAPIQRNDLNSSPMCLDLLPRKSMALHSIECNECRRSMHAKCADMCSSCFT